ncbi:hypothetical protein CC99x_010480 [Candidatus Berkiella cookevillensis]|uniref:RasGEF domain protein n=1 Tax=Candidatus Berkiella cookevillensis TaxID=437022 RepID=A0A0Q9YQ99_9GAMM|nr:RasGEF domain-containing protein [Candidatus Berkiella cookevillensis]MCS5709331.1 hypothetical protein [Candidatus Berkiella cookevillensis]
MPKPKKIQVDNQGVLDLIGIRTVIQSYQEIYNKSQNNIDSESLERRRLVLEALTKELPALIKRDKTKQASFYTENLDQLVDNIDQDIKNLEDRIAELSTDQISDLINIKGWRDEFVRELEVAKTSAKQQFSQEQKQALLAMVKHYNNGHIHSAQRKESAKELKAFIKTLSLPEDYAVFIEKLNEIRQKTFQADAARDKSEVSKIETKSELSFTARMKHFAKQKYQARHKDLKEAMAPLLGGRFQKLLSDLHEESVKKMTMAKGVTPEFKVFSIEVIDLRSMVINIDSSMAANPALKSVFDSIKKDCTEMRFAEAQKKLEKFLNEHEKELSNYQMNQIKQAEIKLSNIVGFVRNHRAIESMIEGSQAQLGKGFIHQILSGYKSPYTWFPGQAITISEESIASYAATLMHVTSPKEIFAEVAKEIAQLPDDQKAAYYNRFQNLMKDMVVADIMPQHIIKGANKENFRAIAKIEKDIESKEKAIDTKQKALVVLGVFNSEKITKLLQNSEQIASALQSRRIQAAQFEAELKKQPDTSKKQLLEGLNKEIKALQMVQEIVGLEADKVDLLAQLAVRKQSEALYSELIANYNHILFDHVPYQKKVQKLINEIDDKIKEKESQIQERTEALKSAYALTAKDIENIGKLMEDPDKLNKYKSLSEAIKGEFGFQADKWALKDVQALLKEKAQLESQKAVYEKNLQAIMPQVDAMNSMLASLHAAGLDVSKFADSMQEALKDKQDRAVQVQALRMQVQAAGAEKKSLDEILQNLPPRGTPEYIEAKVRVANSFTAQSISDLMSIKAYEFLNQNWSKEETKQNSALVKSAIANFNNMSTMIVADILQGSSVEAKEQRAVFYSEIMRECINNNDFNSGMAIIAALNNVQIERLDLLRRPNFKNQDVFKLNLAEAEKIFSQRQQSEMLRNTTDSLLDRGQTVIPFTGPYLSVLTAKDEEPDYLTDPNTSERIINEAKLQKIHAAMSAMLRAQEQVLKDPNYRPTQLVEIAQRAKTAPSEELMWPVLDAAMVKIELDLGINVANDDGEKIAKNIFEIIEAKLKDKDFPEYFRIILKTPGQEDQKIDQTDAYKIILNQLPFAAMQMDVASVDRMLTLIEKMQQRAVTNNQGKKLDDSLEDLFLSTRLEMEKIKFRILAQERVTASQSHAATMTEHMRAPQIPAFVQALSAKGHENYKLGNIEAKAWVMRTDPNAEDSPWPLPQSGAGRQGDWIGQTFGASESVLRQQLSQIPPPRTFSMQEIQSSLSAVAAKDKSDPTIAAPSITIVQGVGVNDLHRTALGQNALLQVASQFDFQEAPGPMDVSVGEYLGDRTQGPQAAIEAAAAALHRKAAKHAGTLDHALTTLLPPSLLTKYPNLYKDGYLNLGTVKDENDKKILLDHISRNIEQLRVLPQWVHCESSGATQMQVFCAAPSFQGMGKPAEGSVEDQICKKLVVAQYVATAQLAVIRARETGETVPLHLTMVGQGAFNNNPSVMKEAMEAVAQVIKGEKVALYVHAYSKEANDALTRQLESGKEKGLFSVATMSASNFKKQKHTQLKAPTTAMAFKAVMDFDNALKSYQLAKQHDISNQIAYYEQQLKGPLKVELEQAIQQLKKASKTGALSEETAQAINPILKSISTHPALSALKLKDLQSKAEFIVQAGQHSQSAVDMQSMMHASKAKAAREPVITQFETPSQSRTVEDIAEVTPRTRIQRSASMSDVRSIDLSAAQAIKQSFIDERKQALAAQAVAHPKLSDEMRVALYEIRDNVEQEIAQIKAKGKILEKIDALNTQLESTPDAKTQEEIKVDLKEAEAELSLIKAAESRLAKLEILEKRIEDVQADFTLEKANKIIVDYKRISQEKDALVKPVEHSAQRLAIAEYVARNIPVWTVATDNLPDRGKGAEIVKVAKVMAGTLITETIDMPLVKGQMFWYASKDIQGLTPATASGNPPTLFGTMAPDQYLLADDIVLNSDPEAIKALASALAGLIISKQKESVEDKDKLEEKIVAELRQADLQFKDPTDSKLWDKLSKIASDHGGSISGRAEAQKIAPTLQACIGKKHVAAIANSVGVGDPKQYAVLTIIGADGSEAKGFGLQERTVLDNQKKAQVSTFGHGDIEVPTISLYQGHDPHIERQLVLQSNGSVQSAQGQAVPGKLNFANSDLAHLLDFYHATMGKNPPIPVAVNCTDGIDRTGMTMVALMMLNAFRKDDFTALSSVEQQRILINMIDGLKQDRGPFFLKGIEDTAIAVAFGYALIAAQKQQDFEKNLQSEMGIDPRIKALLTDKIVAEPDKLLTALKLLSRETDLSQNDSHQINRWIELVADRTHAYEQFSIINNPKSELSKKIDAIPKGPVSSHGSSAVKAAGMFELETAPISHFIKLLDSEFDLNTIRYQGKGIHELAIDRLLTDPSDQNLAELKVFSDKSGKEGQKIMQNYLEEKGYPKDLVQKAKNGNDIQHAMLANPKRYVEIAEKATEKEKKDLVADFIQPAVKVPPQQWVSVKPTAPKDVSSQSQQPITLGATRKSMTVAHAVQRSIASPEDRTQVTIVNDQQLVSKVIKFSEIQANRDKDPKIVQVTQLRNDSDTVNGVMIGFENPAKPERPLRVYACEDKGQTTFSVNKNLPPDSVKQAILTACLLAVRNASPNAVFTIPESASKEKADMIKECFAEAIKKEKHSFLDGQEPKIESKSSPAQALKHK